jgi:16S rRNA C1402 N4-methylase RsmH
MSNYHVSVLLKEAVEALDIKKDGIYVAKDPEL